MTDVGQIERNTQNRIIKLFVERLGYDYLGDWQDRVGNSNIEEQLLRAFLNKQGYRAKVINKAVRKLNKAADVQTEDLYDSNKAVYNMLRYGVSVKASVGVKASQTNIRNREDGIIWHTQGSGKSLTIVWFAQWIWENMTDARVVVITNRRELDIQIARVFNDAKEPMKQATSGADLIDIFNKHEYSLISSLVP